jgi:hypothetical protein
MTYEEFLKFVQAECTYETIYSDSDGRNILVIKLLDAYGMVNKAQRPWVGLTEEDRDVMRTAMVFIKLLDLNNGILDELQPAKEEVLSLLAERLEQSKLKEKNT